MQLRHIKSKNSCQQPVAENKLPAASCQFKILRTFGGITMGRSYRDLVVWQRSMQLVTDIYKITKSFPKEEIYGLTSQIRRAAVSIPRKHAQEQGHGSPSDV